jgi:hypothetical protein
MFNDRPIKVLDEAAFWTLRAIRHSQSKHSTPMQYYSRPKITTIIQRYDINIVITAALLLMTIICS